MSEQIVFVTPEGERSDKGHPIHAHQNYRGALVPLIIVTMMRGGATPEAAIQTWVTIWPRLNLVGAAVILFELQRSLGIEAWEAKLKAAVSLN